MKFGKVRWLLFFGLGLLCCVSQAQAEVFKVGLLEAPPFVFAQSSPLLGVYKEIFVEISKITADTFEFEEADLNNILTVFDKGKIDIEMGVNPMWRKDQPVPGLYTIPFGHYEPVFVKYQGPVKPVSNAKNKKKRTEKTAKSGVKTLALVSGYQCPDLQKKLGQDSWTLLPVGSEEAVFQVLAKQQAEQGIVQLSVAKFLLKSGRIKQPAQYQLGESLASQDVMMRVHPSKAAVIPRLNKAIKILLDNGSIEKIYHHYLFNGEGA